MSKGKKKPSLYDLSHEHLNPSDVEDFHKEILHGTDRSIALVGAALVDSALLRVLTIHFVEMDEKHFNAMFFKEGAPLASFSSRIRMGHALGVYDDHLMGILDIIRRVRNAFAHSLRPIDFNHPLVIEECEGLPKAKLKDKLTHSLKPLAENYVAICANIEGVLLDHGKRNVNKKISVDLMKAAPSPDISDELQLLSSQNLGDA